MADEGDGYEAGVRLCAALDRAPGRAAWRSVLARCEEIHRRGDALCVGALAIDGRDVIEQLGLHGAAVGLVLQHLLAEVLEHPEKNRREELFALARAWIAASGTRTTDHP